MLTPKQEMQQKLSRLAVLVRGMMRAMNTQKQWAFHGLAAKANDLMDEIMRAKEPIAFERAAFPVESWLCRRMHAKDLERLAQVHTSGRVASVSQ